MQLLSLLGLSSVLFTGLTQARSTSNDKLCQVNDDPNKCTVTVVRNDKHSPPPGLNGAGEQSTWVYVLDNECNSIIDSTDCTDEGEDTPICKITVPEDSDSITVPVKGMDTEVVVDGTGDGDDLQGYTPLFVLHWGKYTTNDHENNDEPCTCAQSNHGLTKAEACSCWITAGDV